MIQAKDLRIGNLAIWNPKLLNPNNTLPPFQIQVFSILPDKISYVFPNIENRVEPFEDDKAQMGERYKRLEELEPIELTAEILHNEGFIEKGGLSNLKYYEKRDLQLKQTSEYFKRISVNASHIAEYDLPIRFFHQLQNLFFALTGEELETKVHGQQS
jgi:hypothetical protein